MEELHKRRDELAEAANATDIIWLKRGLRLLFSAVLGIRGVAIKPLL